LLSYKYYPSSYVPEKPRKKYVAWLPSKKETVYPKFEAGFDVEVRKGGKWIKATAVSMPEAVAKSYGARLTELTPRASFKLTPSGKVVSKRKLYWPFPTSRFRAPIKKGKTLMGTGIYIEKSKFRIDMPKEVMGITRKGIWAAKQKRGGWL